jgi:hypothetical protein
MASHNKRIPAVAPLNDSDINIVDTSPKAIRRFSSRTRVPIRTTGSRPKPQQSTKPSPRKTSTSETQIESDAAFALMLHEEDLSIGGKKLETRKPSIKTITKLSKDRKKQTEIRTFEGRDGKKLKCKTFIVI